MPLLPSEVPDAVGRVVETTIALPSPTRVEVSYDPATESVTLRVVADAGDGYSASQTYTAGQLANLTPANFVTQVRNAVATLLTNVANQIAAPYFG
jgi:hypothetical protein